METARAQALIEALTRFGHGAPTIAEPAAIIAPVKGTPNTAWHAAHRMPKHPTLAERVAWHQKHLQVCGCRPMPESIQRALVAGGNQPRAAKPR